ncbi:Organic cation transporter protein, partial [Harpegnathos saltator]
VNVKGVSNGKDEHVDADGNIDAVQTAIGDLGRWQIFVCLAISLVKFPVAWHQLAIVFMAPQQDYNCTVPATTDSEDQCAVDVNGTLVECTEWTYDRSIFSETIISQHISLTKQLRSIIVRTTLRALSLLRGLFSLQWNLVCDRTHYANIQQSILMFGVLLGNIIFGSLADRQVHRSRQYGRKMPLMASVVLQLLSGIGCAIVPWFQALLLMKFLSMEIIGTEWRAAINFFYQIPYCLGHMSLAGLAFWFRHWRHLQIAITLPSIVCLSYWWLVPESPRWLIAVGKQRAACKILQKAANINKVKNVDIPEVVRKHCLQQNFKKSALDHKPSFLDLFRTPNMRVKSLSIFFNWIVCGVVLFGMSQYIGQVGGDIFINFAVSGVIQLPGCFVGWWTMNKFGRRVTLIYSNLIAGVSCLLLIAVLNDSAWVRLLLASFGIVGTSVSFMTAYLFSGELFPTVVRNIGVGASSMFARLGSIVAPFVVSL